MLNRFQRRLFGLPLTEATFARRGFPPADPEVQAHLEHAAQTFVQGYNQALAETDVAILAAGLRELALEFHPRQGAKSMNRTRLTRLRVKRPLPGWYPGAVFAEGSS